MEGTPTYVLGILGAVPLVVLVLCIIDKLKIATSLSILFLSSNPFLLGLIYQFSAPTIEPQKAFSPAIPYLIGFILVLMAIASFLPIINKNSSPQNSAPTISRWFLLLGGYIFHLVAITGSLIYWYAPGIVGMSETSPLGGVIVYNIAFVASAVLMYLASKKNSEKRPNLMRKIITLLIVFGISETALIISFILIYAFPSQPAASFPNEASYVLVSILTLGTLLFMLNQETVNQIKS